MAPLASPDVDTDLDVLTLLDEQLDSRIPCQGIGHAEGKWGCSPADPGHWRILKAHDGTVATCDPHPLIICDGHLDYLRRTAAALCKAEQFGPILAFAVCARCKYRFTNPDELLVVIGEVL